jgi:hypothetical protein
MNPLISFGLADLARAQEAQERRMVWRVTSASVPLEAIKRDGRWAAAIASWSKAEHDVQANVGCSTVGCATA